MKETTINYRHWHVSTGVSTCELKPRTGNDFIFFATQPNTTFIYREATWTATKLNVWTVPISLNAVSIWKTWGKGRSGTNGKRFVIPGGTRPLMKHFLQTYFPLLSQQNVLQFAICQGILNRSNEGGRSFNRQSFSVAGWLSVPRKRWMGAVAVLSFKWFIARRATENWRRDVKVFMRSCKIIVPANLSTTTMSVNGHQLTELSTPTSKGGTDTATMRCCAISHENTFIYGLIVDRLLTILWPAASISAGEWLLQACCHGRRRNKDGHWQFYFLVVGNCSKNSAP